MKHIIGWGLIIIGLFMFWFFRNNGIDVLPVPIVGWLSGIALAVYGLRILLISSGKSKTTDHE